MRLTILSILALAGCATSGGPPLLSTQFPPNAESAKSEPQTASSLPVGAANLGPTPNATAPDIAAIPLPAF